MVQAGAHDRLVQRDGSVPRRCIQACGEPVVTAKLPDYEGQKKPMQTTKTITVNDIHSQLNAADVTEVVVPASVDEARRLVIWARDRGGSLSIAGGRHAMGGQQFLSGGTLLDTRELRRIIALDPERGIVTVEAGILWSDLVSGLRAMQPPEADRRWSIVQKQTGADRLSIGGALAANGHGRGLTYRPIVQDVDAFEMITADGELIRCDRENNAELFRLAIGGYGLFGVITTVDLRLMPAHHLRRVVEVTTVDEVPAVFADRICGGFTYGDFQYRTDELSSGFLKDGVLSCYLPVAEDEACAASPPQNSADGRRPGGSFYTGPTLTRHARSTSMPASTGAPTGRFTTATRSN